MKSATAVRLADVARHADVSPATASMALSDHPRIAAATKQRVRAAAETLGYFPDPLLRALASRRHRHRAGWDRPALAFVTTFATERALRHIEWTSAYLAGARVGAERLGYTLQLFHLPAESDSPRVNTRILRSRGVRGLLLGGIEGKRDDLPLEWQEFACAAVGDNANRPPLPCARPDHFRATRLLMAELRARGYRRPALLTDSLEIERHQAASLAAFLADIWLWDLGSESARLVARWDQGAATALRRIVRDAAPDVLVAVTPELALRARETLPRRIPVVSLNATGDLPGVAFPLETIAAEAVRILHNQLTSSRRGPSPHCERLDFEGAWQEGSGLPRRDAL